ncbi:MAG: hypothetical protein H7A23_04520 [Leptospiraceae bacterium]|nr:hypothetical protein [Leptospiraceae bacterium]
MILEPSDTQRKHLTQITGPVAIVTFFAPQNGLAVQPYLSTSQRAVEQAGGVRLHSPTIDHVLAGQPLPFTYFTIDQFPNSSSAIQAHDAVATERSNTFSELHALIVRPNKQAVDITKVLSYLRPIFRIFAHIDEQKPINPDKVLTPPNVHATPEQYKVLQSHNQSTPFYNLNLTKCYDREAVQKQMVRQIYLPSLVKLLGLGGYLEFSGDVLGTWIGDDSQSLYDQWEEFTLAHWPSRRIFQIYLANVSDQVAESRKTYFARAVQIACSNSI